MKKICTTSVLFLLILINKNFSQYTFVEDPADQTFECMPSNSNFDPILDYLNGLSAIEVNCNGIDAILTWDYTGEFPSCDESVNIVITAEDACGDFPNQEYPIVVTIFDTQAPYIEFIAEPEPIECVKEIILNQGFENVINALIDDALAFDTNACTDPNDLIWFITPDHTIPPQAADIPDLNCPGGSLTGTYEFEVLVEDECGNRSQPETISIVVQDTKSPAFPMALPPDLYLECLEDMEGGMEQFPNDDCEAPPAIMVEVQISDFCTYEFERKWIFEDYCGNVAGEHIQAIFVKDTTAPTWIGDTSLFLPQDITVYIDDCTEPYYFPNNYFESELTGEAWPHFPLENNVHFEDNCDGVSFRQLVIPPSEAFPEGVTKITYIVRDECFNVLKHEFTVSVVCNNCFTSGIVTESCNTEPDAFFCEMTDLFGHIACTPPDTLGEPVWPFPDQLCDGVGEATNISWFSFVASSKDMCLFASVLNCKTNNKSLSAGIYDSCENDNGQCIVSDATCDNDGYVRLVTRDLIVGREYFLFVAGLRWSSM